MKKGSLVRSAGLSIVLAVLSVLLCYLVFSVKSPVIDSEDTTKYMYSVRSK